MQRLNFESGVQKLRGWVRVPAGLVYLALIAFLGFEAWNVSAGERWPLSPWLSDPVLWLMIAATMAGPLIEGLFWLLIGGVVALARQFFVDADSSDLSDLEWNAAQLYRLVTAVINYLNRAVSWGVLLLILYIIDSHPGPTPYWTMDHPLAARWGFTAALIFGYAVLRFISYYAIDMTVEMALEKRIASNVGPEAGERYNQFSLKVYERMLSGRALDRLLGLGPPPANRY